MPESEWYASWFDTGYYHLLYQQRDFEEAKNFVHNLMHHLKLEERSQVCDLACGNGRHSEVLASLGYDVTGLDLSSNNIAHARKRGIPHAEFYEHDMRKLFRSSYFDLVLNLFTSFGYFDSDEEHLDTLKAIFQSLKPQGHFVLDYLNSQKLETSLIPESSYEISGVQFEVSRAMVNGFIQKSIHIFEENKSIRFQEKVRAFSLSDLQKMMEQCGFRVIEVFGDYALAPYEEMNSDRLIIHATK